MANYMEQQNHPEQLEDEIFLTNHSLDDLLQNATFTSAWKTWRVGNIAYDKKGVIIPSHRPIFIKLSEIEEVANGDSFMAEAARRLLKKYSKGE